MAQTRTYEGMFLVDGGQPDFKVASEPIEAALRRTEAQVMSIRPWEDRRLAYDIRGRKRGLYILAYFKVDPLRVVEIEQECQLDERVLRTLILAREELTDEQLQAETPATAAARHEAERQAAAEAEAPEAEKAKEAEKAEPAEAKKGEPAEAEAESKQEPAERKEESKPPEDADQSKDEGESEKKED